MNYKITTDPSARLRIDKWLWAARFFKTRSLAADAIGRAHVRIGGDPVKASRDVRVGDLVEIEIDYVVWEVQVLGLCDVRSPASVAQTLYVETETGRARRAAEQERRRLFREPAAVLHGRPTKRDRRTIDKLGRGE